MEKTQHIISWRAKLYFCFFCFLCAVAGMFFSYRDFVDITVREIIEPRFNFMVKRIHKVAHKKWGGQVNAQNYDEASAWMKSRLEDSFMATRFSAFVYKDGKFYVKLSSEPPEKVPFMSDAQPLLNDYADELKTFLSKSANRHSFRKYDAVKKSIVSCIFPKDSDLNGEDQFFCAEGQVYSQSAVRHAIADLFEKFVLLMILAFLPFFLFAREVLSARVNTLEKIVDNRTKALQNALDKAEESMRLKAQFMANVNHELRTPLNAIAGFSELMVQEMFGPIGNEKYKEYAASIHSSAVLLTDLINRVLDAAKYESGKAEVHNSWFYLQDVVGGVMSVIKGYPDADKRKITVKNTVKKAVYADKNIIIHILLNLLSNAIKYTNSGGKIDVCIFESNDGGMVISCADNGSGIPQKMQESVFMPFVQLENAVTKEHKGTGLGLYLVRKMARLSGGEVSVSSDGMTGSVFTVVFPPTVFEHNGKELKED